MTTLTRRSVSYRTLLLLVTAALLLCLIPLLYMGRYDVPCADDYNYGIETHRCLMQGGSLLQVLGVAAERTATTYRIWQGSYAAVFLMCLQPAVFSEKLYWITPWLMSLSLLGGLYILCTTLFQRLFELPRRLGAITAGMLGILFLLLVPIPVQSFYWFNGAVYYTFFFGISLAALALAVKTAQEGGTLRCILLCLLALFLGGGNLVTALSCAILAVSALILLPAAGKKREALRLLAPALALLLGFALNVAAPGNAIRALSVEHTPNAVAAILASFEQAAIHALRWLRLPVLAAMLFLWLLFRGALPASRFPFRFPVLVTLYSFCLYAAMFCPTMYALGNPGDWRLRDIIYYAFLLLLALNVLYWTGWVCRRRGRESAAAPRLLPTLLCLLLCVLCLGISAKLQGGISLASAYTSLRSGQAAVYSRQAEERVEILRDPQIRDAELDAFLDPPYLLFFDDITPDPLNWRNLGMSAFYGKDSVVLRDTLPADGA